MKCLQHGLSLANLRRGTSASPAANRVITSFDPEAQALLHEVCAEIRNTCSYTGRNRLDERVMRAMLKVPRHAFVPDELHYIAYTNRPLPIGHGQTISQPFIVALMTDLIAPQADDVVLELGTGSGYQAAILACLVKQVYSLEIIDTLATQASRRLQSLGYHNVEVHSGNGRCGLPEHAPYDSIIVTAAAAQIPPALVEQLKPGGRLVIPVGQCHSAQQLVIIDKSHDGKIVEKSILPVAFVPLVDGPDAT